jgi:hypothetical protein
LHREVNRKQGAPLAARGAAPCKIPYPHLRSE